MAIQFDTSDLRLVIYVAEMSSLTAGADRAFLSLPAASARLKRLEENLGIKLFNRSRQGFELTQAGQVMVRHWRAIYMQLERMCRELQQYVHGSKGTLRIAASTAAVMCVVPELLPLYLAKFADINVEVRELQSREITRAIREDAADIGIVSGEVEKNGLEVIPYRDDELVVVMAIDHALNSFDEITFSAALAYDQVGLMENSALTRLLMKEAKDSQLAVRFRTTVHDAESVCRIVEANAAIGILPKAAAKKHAKNLKIRYAKISDAWAAQKLSLVFKDSKVLPGFASAFIEMMLKKTSLKEAA